MCGMQLEDVGTTPGSCGLTLHGYDMRVLDPETKEEVEDGVMGSIAIKLPMPPGFMHSLFNNHPRFVSAYMEEFPGYYDAGDAGFRDENGCVGARERVCERETEGARENSRASVRARNRWRAREPAS